MLRVVSLPLRASQTHHVRSMSYMVSRVRTGVTAALWNKRFELEQYKNDATKQQEVMVPKAPSESHMSIELPVCTDHEIRDQYRNFRGGIQFGKLLEDIDAFAGNIAFLHCDDANPETKKHRLELKGDEQVTASVDRLDLTSPITLGLEDLLLTGEAGWAGRSSLQIDLQLVPDVKEGPARAGGGPPCLKGSVVFVAVNENNKGVPINPLVPATDEERANFEAGARMNQQRKEARNTSLKHHAPKEDEIARLHAMMVQPPPAGSPHAALADTALDSVLVMQPQVTSPLIEERNRSGKIFGGFLMHKAYELAFATASKFAVKQGGAPTVFALDDVSFAKPVSIGDVITFTSTVVYTGSDELRGGPPTGASLPVGISSVFQVRVGTNIVNLSDGTSSLSNEFHFTFFNRNASTQDTYPLQPVPVVGVVPHSYSEGMLWIDGRRRMLEALAMQQHLRGVFAHSIGY